MSEIKSLKNIDNEYLLVSYFLHNERIDNPSLIDHFQNIICQSILMALRDMVDEGLQFSIDTLYIRANEIRPFDREILENIYNNYLDFKNITFHLSKLTSDYTKQVVVKTILEDLIISSRSFDEIKTSDILKKVDEVKRVLHSSGSTDILKDNETLASEHMDRLEKRLNGDNKKYSIGFRTLDAELARPANPGELTIIGALRGSSKSIFIQTIHNNLMRKGNVCIVHFSIEMAEESNMDRALSMRTGLSMYDFNRRIDQNKFDIAKNELISFSEHKNYLSTDEAMLTFNDIDAALYRAKDIFRSRGILPEDEYMVYSIDLLDMVQDFGEGKPTDIRMAMNTWNILNKKHNCHGIGLVQVNENKLRGRIFKDPEDIDSYIPNLEDIYGGSAFAQRARNVFLLHRPRYMKERIFPEAQAVWGMEPDIINCHVAKQSDGHLFLRKFLFEGEKMKITPYYMYDENYKQDFTETE